MRTIERSNIGMDTMKGDRGKRTLQNNKVNNIRKQRKKDKMSVTQTDVHAKRTIQQKPKQQRLSTEHNKEAVMFYLGSLFKSVSFVGLLRINHRI